MLLLHCKRTSNLAILHKVPVFALKGKAKKVQTRWKLCFCPKSQNEDHLKGWEVGSSGLSVFGGCKEFIGPS